MQNKRAPLAAGERLAEPSTQVTKHCRRYTDAISDQAGWDQLRTERLDKLVSKADLEDDHGQRTRKA